MLGLLEIAAGPFVALIGIVAVFIVMRHRSVQTKSMYSARRGQIERKVRAARQRTLAPSSKRTEKEDAAAAAAEQAFVGPGMEAKTAVPTATWGPPAGLPAVAPAPQFPPQQPQQQPVWEVGPTVPPPPSAPIPSPPAPPPYEPAYQAPPPPAEVWTPAPMEPVAPRPEPMPQPVAPQVSTPAGGGAAWSIVGDSKDVAAEAAPDKKTKKDKRQPQMASWQLSPGGLPGDEADEEIKRPSQAIALAQYAVLVVGLVMVLIGVVVKVANSHVT